jgi:hypothetical protein
MLGLADVRPLRPAAYPNGVEAFTGRVRISSEHRLDAVARNLGQIGVVDASGTQVRHVGVAALVGADI